MRLHGGGASFHGLAEDRLILHELAAHAPPLRTLPAHHESDAWRMCSTWREGHAHLIALLTRRVAIALLDHFSYRMRDEGEPIRVVIAPGPQRI